MINKYKFYYRMVKLTCNLGTSNVKVVEVKPYEQINVLLERLNITDKKTKFMFKGKTYSMASVETFEEIGLTYDTKISLNNQPISGGGMTFTDVSKKNTINIGFSSSAPSYRTAEKGINIFGICKKSGCKAYEKEVIVPV